MALFRKFFYRKPPDGLLEISERVYVFESCFTTDVWEEDDYKVYVGGIMGQLHELYADASFMLFNFREGEKQSQVANILSDYDVTVMEYPRHYEGCPLLTMEMMHHFLRSSENWLSLGQQNVVFMHCERGGWPVLAFMLAALLIYRKQFNGELKTLNMIYKQAPRELLQLMSPLNPIPSQLRYLQYVSRRNLGSEWPPLDRGLTLDCIILRFIPIMDSEGGCCPIFRIYGQDPFMAADGTPKVLFSTPKRSKFVRHFKQADCELVKIDIHCHIQGDVVLECITLDNGMEREEMMFRVMFNTAFIRSNILMLNRDDVDMLWNIKDQFPNDFRAEVIFSEMDAAASLNLIDLPCIEEKEGLPIEAFAKVQEIFSGVDWLDTKTDEALNVLQQITVSNALQGKLNEAFSQNVETDCLLLESAPDKLTFEQTESEDNIQRSKSMGQERHSAHSIESPEDENFVNKIQSQQLQDATLLRRNIESQKVLDAVPVRMETESWELPDTSLVGRKIQPQEPFCGNSTKEKIEPQAKHDGRLTKKETEAQELHSSLQWPAQLKIISQRVPQTTVFLPTSPSNSLQDSPISLSRFQSLPTALGITALLHDHAVSNREELRHHPVTASPTSKAISLPNLNSLNTVQPNNLRIPVPPPLPRWPSLLQSLGDSSMIENTPFPPPPSSTSISSPLQGLFQFSSSSLSFSVSSPSSLAKKVNLAPPSSSCSPTSRPLPSTIKNSISTSFPTTSTQSVLETSSSSSTKDLVFAFPPPPLGKSSLDTIKTLFSSSSTSLSPPPYSSTLPYIYVGSNSSLSMKNSEFVFALPPPPPPPPPPLPRYHRPTSNSTKVSFVPPSPPPTHTKAPYNSTTISFVPTPPPPPTHPRPPSKSTSISSLPPPPLPSHLRPPSNSTTISFVPPSPPPPPPPPLPHQSPPFDSTTISFAPPPPFPSLTHLSPPPNSTTSFAPPPPLPTSSKNPLPSKSTNAPPVPPLTPLIIGVPKASNASSCSHSGIGNGNVPSVPGPPSVPLGNGRGLSRVGPRIHGQAKKSNLKPYHWLKLTRAIQGSLWAEAQKSDDASKAPEFDMSELESLFSASTPNSDSIGGKSNHRTSGPKPEKVQLIELRRAYNCEIMLSKVKIPLPDLLSSVLTLDESAFDIDQVENLIKFSPTKEEMELLKNYNGDMEKLGKCERFFLELMKVPRVESKLRVFAFKIQFDSQVSDLRKNLNIVNSVAEEIRNSTKLKRIMQTILSLGNALNQGTARGSAIGFRLDSLLKLTDTRARNNKMTLMHYLCKVLAEKVPELLDFPKDLVSLEPSTKIQLKYLAEEMQAISKGLEKVVQELTTSGNDGAFSEIFCKTLKEFLSYAEAEVRSLASLYSFVGRNADALALYFGEDPARCPFEQVVSTLQNFVRMYVRALEENCKQLEFKKKRAQKEAPKEKMKLDPSKKESENLIQQPPVKSHDIK